MHLTRQAVDVIISEKNNSSKPVIIAPAILVAANVIPRRITAVNIVPRIPRSKRGSIMHTHPLTPVDLISGAEISETRRYTTAIPNNTHRNAGVTVITAVIRSTVVITPMITLAITARAVQLFLQPQLQLVIKFTSRNSL